MGAQVGLMSGKTKPQFRRRSDFVHGGEATLTEMEGQVLAPPACNVAMEDTLCLGVV